jgi:hypothetical protein
MKIFLLQTEVPDFSLLLTKGYAEKGALKLAGELWLSYSPAHNSGRLKKLIDPS